MYDEKEEFIRDIDESSMSETYKSLPMEWVVAIAIECRNSLDSESPDYFTRRRNKKRLLPKVYND